ncbi:helix-turn-helix domain-containing protein [Hominenteromicrobium sp.]|uniref:helix-turn-helix domain-containing protein n=1 Tax=Hominenteromicrobium sp. TaxID=3073581 RepID=UPI003AF10DE9
MRRSDKILWNHCCCDNMQILWLPFTMKCVSDCSCEGADVLNDFLCGKLSSVGYNTQLIDYSDFLRKRVCSYTKCCLNQVLSGFILDCIFTLKQNYDGLTNKDKITQYLLDHATEKISVPELAKKLSISERALFYYFQDNFGSTPSNYINRIRMNAAAEHIHRGLSVKEVTEMYHFSESSAFCRLFKKYFGITPTEYRQLAEKSQLKIVSRDKLKD